MPRYKVHYVADIWESVIVEADSKKHAQELFETHDDNYFEAREDEPEQHGMENIKVDMVEELNKTATLCTMALISHCASIST